MTGRVTHWERHLASLVTAAQARAFDWRSVNCALFAADAVLAVTGQDPAADYRETAWTAESAATLLAEAGGLAGLMATRAAAHGWPEVPVRFAQRGDVLLADFPGGPTLGVCVGRDVVFPRQPAGLVALPITSARLTRAWAIGRAR